MWSFFEVVFIFECFEFVIEVIFIFIVIVRKAGVGCIGYAVFVFERFLADDRSESFFGRHKEFIHCFVVGFGVCGVAYEDRLRIEVVIIIIVFVIDEIGFEVLVRTLFEFRVLESRFLFGWFEGRWSGIVVDFVGRGDA